MAKAKAKGKSKRFVPTNIVRRTKSKAQPKPKQKPQREDTTMASKNNYAEAKEELNRAAVHAQDALKKAFERTDADKDEDYTSAMASLQKSFEDIVEDANALAEKKEKSSKKEKAEE